MEIALYATIWIALALFVSGRAVRSWPLFAAGFAIAVIHILIAMDLRHGWSHASAMAATAQQTNTVFGLDWGGGVWVNYAFMTAWLAELIAWRVSPARYLAWSGWSVWTTRAIYFIVIANAAIVFAAGWRRALGAALVLALVASWWDRDRSHVGNVGNVGRM